MAQIFSDELERAITTPHDHEGEGNKPLWIVWKMDIGGDGLTDGPQLECVCDDEANIRYQVHAMLERAETGRSTGNFLFHVERVPANHNFGHTDLQAYQRFIEAGGNRATMLRFSHRPVASGKSDWETARDMAIRRKEEGG